MAFWHKKIPLHQQRDFFMLLISGLLILRHTLHIKLPLLQIEAVAFGKDVNDDVLNGDGGAFFQVGNVGVTDVVSVDDDDQARSDRFHVATFGDQYAGVLAQPDPDAGWVGCNSLSQASETTALYEV